MTSAWPSHSSSPPPALPTCASRSNLTGLHGRDQRARRPERQHDERRRGRPSPPRSILILLPSASSPRSNGGERGICDIRHATCSFPASLGPYRASHRDLREVGSSILGSVHEPARPSSPTDRITHRCGGQRGRRRGPQSLGLLRSPSPNGALTGCPHQEKPHGMACSCGTVFDLSPPDCWLGSELVRGGGRADLRSGGAGAVGCPRPAAFRDQESVRRVSSDENAPRRPGASRETSFLEKLTGG